MIAMLIPAVAAPMIAFAQTGLPIPRFVSLRSDEVNVRTGPGRQYPIEWVYVRAGLPVEIIAEFDTWRRIRDREGSQGWVHQSLLSGRRSAIITAAETVTVLRRPTVVDQPVARLEPGVQVRLDECPGEAAENNGWCRIEIGGHNGWLPREQLWGLYPDEEVE